MSLDPAFSGIALLFDYVQVATANTGRDGTGTLATLSTGVAAGKIITGPIMFQATVTTAAGMMRLFLSNDTGSTKRLIDEIPTPAYTAAATTQAPVVYSTKLIGFNLYTTAMILYASTNNTETWNVFCPVWSL